MILIIICFELKQALPNFNTEVFRKVYGIHTSLDFIRKSHIINFYDQPKKLSNNEKKAFVDLMAHSAEEANK